MYENHFGLIERPFSIAPDPQYLFMSRRHKEAMAHLSYGLTQGGCFIVLTGEVGTGKTTLCRNLLSELPEHVDVALILNANINEHELLQSICDELRIDYEPDASQKLLLDAINQHLLATFSENRHTVLIIDEAQILSRDVLEQIRLLTNLETTKSKLLQIILIGQPELNDVLSRQDLRQLAQRVTARYHLGPLDKSEIEDYVNFRLSVAGCKRALFSRQALTKLHAITEGIPRKINVLADHSLLAAYAAGARVVDAKTVKSAANDVFVTRESTASGVLPSFARFKWPAVIAGVVIINLALWFWYVQSRPEPLGDLVETAPVQDRDSRRDGSAPAAEVEAETVGSAPQQLGQSQPQPQVVGKVIVAEEPLDATTEIPEELAAQFSVAQSEPEDEPAPMEEQSGSNEIDAEGLTATLTDSNQLERLLATSADRTSRINAFRRLTRLWGENLPDVLINPACGELATKGLRCLAFEDWGQWLRYNRPAILVLQQEQQLHRVLVTSIQNETATVMVGEQTTIVPVSELQQLWAGQGLILWKPRSAGVTFLSPGDRGPAVIAAREQLNLALAAVGLPLLSNADQPDFDLDMEQKLFALQTRYNIINDSKIGNETRLLLNELTAGQTIPVLRPRS